ncbi:hypothetical protein B1R94_02250 [Mycolicibacterium litorale]|nr:hypothetical protein B1R94_02250 [Mycolicibacterium litorale]
MIGPDREALESVVRGAEHAARLERYFERRCAKEQGVSSSERKMQRAREKAAKQAKKRRRNGR